MKSGLRAVAVASLVVLCTVTAGVIALALAPAAGAASTGNSASSALETWYQRTGHPTLQTFTADIQRFQEVTGPQPRVWLVKIAIASSWMCWGQHTRSCLPRRLWPLTIATTSSQPLHVLRNAYRVSGQRMRYKWPREHKAARSRSKRRSPSSREPDTERLSIWRPRARTSSLRCQLHWSSRSATRTSRSSKSPRLPTTPRITPLLCHPRHGVRQPTTEILALS